MHPKNPYWLWSYARIPPMGEMCLVLGAPAAQRLQQHQALAQGKALPAHLKLQVGFPVGSIARSRAAFSFGIFQIWTLAWIFQPASSLWKKAAHHGLPRYCSVFAQPHHALTHQPRSPKHSIPWQFSLLEQPGSFELAIRITLQLRAVCALIPEIPDKQKDSTATPHKQKALAANASPHLTFMGVQLALTVCISQSLIKAVSLI